MGAERAKSYCRGWRDGNPCPVLMQCLHQAIVDNEVFGIWGGTGQRERTRVRKIWKDTGRLVDVVALDRVNSSKRRIS